MTARIAITSIILALVAPTLAAAHEYEAGDVRVAHPWARATPGGASVGAAYLEISNKAGVADTLVSASSPSAESVEIHTHTMEDGVMKMRKLDALPISAGSSTVLRPSGDHIMLLGLKAPLKEGDLLPITLVFEKAGSITVSATVEPVGATGPHGLDHQPGDEKDHDHH